MSNPDSPWRDGHEGRAPAGMFRAARRWSQRHGRWAAIGTDERLQDFEGSEARDEREKWKNT